MSPLTEVALLGGAAVLTPLLIIWSIWTEHTAAPPPPQPVPGWVPPREFPLPGPRPPA